MAFKSNLRDRPNSGSDRRYGLRQFFGTVSQGSPRVGRDVAEAQIAPAFVRPFLLDVRLFHFRRTVVLVLVEAVLQSLTQISVIAGRLRGIPVAERLAVKREGDAARVGSHLLYRNFFFVFLFVL